MIHAADHFWAHPGWLRTWTELAAWIRHGRCVLRELRRSWVRAPKLCREIYRDTPRVGRRLAPKGLDRWLRWARGSATGRLAELGCVPAA